MPTQTMTAVVPMTSGWNRIHSEQSSSSTPVKMVQGAHVAAQSDGAETAHHQPEPEEDGQRGGRKPDVEDQDDAEDDLDDPSGHHPAAARDEVFVGRGEHDLQDARNQHQPSEDERHAQVALGRVDENQHADREERDADDQQQPPVADGLFRIFDQ